MSADSFAKLNREIVACRRCPRLVRYREKVAREKRRAFMDWSYWGKPVPGFGDPKARILIVGLAPGAHGANRTGRPFTGDRSGYFLYPALHRAGLSNQPTAESRDDGLLLNGCYVNNAARCVPPDNLPSRQELSNCSSFFERELSLLKPKVILALGAIAWAAVLTDFESRGTVIPKPRPKFAHGRELELPGRPVLLGSFHVSAQNTNTGRLTEQMFDAVLNRAKRIASTKASP